MKLNEKVLNNSKVTFISKIVLATILASSIGLAATTGNVVDAATTGDTATNPTVSNTTPTTPTTPTPAATQATTPSSTSTTPVVDLGPTQPGNGAYPAPTPGTVPVSTDPSMTDASGTYSDSSTTPSTSPSTTETVYDPDAQGTATPQEVAQARLLDFAGDPDLYPAQEAYLPLAEQNIEEGGGYTVYQVYGLDGYGYDVAKENAWIDAQHPTTVAEVAELVREAQQTIDAEEGGEPYGTILEQFDSAKAPSSKTSASTAKPVATSLTSTSKATATPMSATPMSATTTKSSTGLLRGVSASPAKMSMTTGKTSGSKFPQTGNMVGTGLTILGLVIAAIASGISYVKATGKKLFGKLF
ncbi:hypothetical protein [Companilactobacillus sp.]|jgi:hypothetical protein|uniref:hypothetical protein n=1 Tax=Companilactobacillus sp. TaxID=2767905 RepID=UPI0025BD36B0|nr:hypothetical protein [Companilactobacillus sp.]MCH4009337.1 hypothetical protein [Companilactobacillus sp.]MCH4050484.1 hypothetical protein [Companilactobacillus sp.]MCH4077279.1 hypothetical protein [Companilactobacillus sp.]MCH4125855.1 hypothetical protein [Companilactobacillus sp.]MCI1311564.1 hypothetical protein [Companilactobacillus sp.]